MLEQIINLIPFPRYPIIRKNYFSDSFTLTAKKINENILYDSSQEYSTENNSLHTKVLEETGNYKEKASAIIIKKPKESFYLLKDKDKFVAKIDKEDYKTFTIIQTKNKIEFSCSKINNQIASETISKYKKIFDKQERLLNVSNYKRRFSKS